MSTREILLEAAERIVREDGPSGLTVRSLATRTNFGKSTVHESVGGMEELWNTLRVRALAEALQQLRAQDDPQPLNAEERREMHLRLGEWVVANPHWAELAFSLPSGPISPPPNWAVDRLVKAVGATGLEVGDAELEALVRYAARVSSAAVQAVIETKDPLLAEATFGTMYELLGATIARLDEPQSEDSSSPEIGG